MADVGLTDDLNNSLTIFDDETGFGTYTFTIPTTGSYTLGTGVVDYADTAVSSGLLIDNLSLGALSTPENIPLVIDPVALLANDTDADNDELVITAVGNAVNGYGHDR